MRTLIILLSAAIFVGCSKKQFDKPADPVIALYEAMNSGTKEDFINTFSKRAQSYMHYDKEGGREDLQKFLDEGREDHYEIHIDSSSFDPYEPDRVDVYYTEKDYRIIKGSPDSLYETRTKKTILEKENGQWKIEMMMDDIKLLD